MREYPFLSKNLINTCYYRGQRYSLGQMYRKKMMITFNIPHFHFSFSVRTMCIDQFVRKKRNFKVQLPYWTLKLKLELKSAENPKLDQESPSM